MWLLKSSRELRVFLSWSFFVMFLACSGGVPALAANTSPVPSVPPSPVPGVPPSDTACTRQMLNWSQNGQFCGTISNSVPSGETVSVTDSSGTTGSASFTCTNGSWGMPVNPVCAAAPILTGATVTDIKIVNTGTASQSGVPVTFGQVFAPGDVPAGSTLTGTLSDGTPIALQVDAKATHADGSLRHAIISTVIPDLASGQTETIALTKATRASAPASVSPATLTAAGFRASVNIMLGGVVYTASADSLLNALKTSTCTACKWLSGPIVNEWLVSAPLKTAAGVAHPHLTARFAIRSYTGQSKARVDVTIENNWAYVTNPQNFTYDANIIVGGSTVYSISALKHYHHARWRKIFWYGTAPQVDVKLNTAYLIATKAVPNYDQSINISPAALTKLNSLWTSAGSQANADGANNRTGPMGQGVVAPYMPTTGGRGDIGPLPYWAAMYLLSGDARAKTVTLGTGDLAGSWRVHYRDKDTDLPISIVTYPYASAISGDLSQTKGPGPGGIVRDWAFPALVSGFSTTPMTPDSSHQPSLAYLPYLITGDYYYLEELQFWANWNMLQIGHGSRTYAGRQGLMRWNQIRGQAWSMRTLGQVAYITPDKHPMKSYWMDRVRDNLADYHERFITGNPNQLGILAYTASYFFASIQYTTPMGVNTGYPPWQDDFFTWSMGYLTELGFTNAAPILAWKAKFPVGRMTAPGYCYVDAATYALAVRPSATSPVYTTLAEAWSGNFNSLVDTKPQSSTYNLYYKNQACGSAAQALWLKNNGKNIIAGQMTSGGAESYAANMQPALAVAATSGIVNAEAAWTIFKNATRKINYTTEPQFAVVPRN